MSGWHISIYRQKNGSTSPASFGATHGTRLAVWVAGSEGLDWINELINEKKVIALGGGGYPTEFTAMTRHLKAQILKGPPYAMLPWNHPADTASPWLRENTAIDADALNDCLPDEWLLIQAWDES